MTPATPSEPGILLACSAGLLGYCHHAATLLALEASQLVPSAFCGASSGALVAFLAAGGRTPAEVAKLTGNLRPVSLLDVEFVDARRPWRGIAVSARKYRDWLNDSVPGRINEGRLLVSVRQEDSGRIVAVDHGDMAAWVAASGAIPGLISPMTIENTLYSDPGPVERAPIMSAASRFRPNLLIVSWLQRAGRSEAQPPAPEYLARRIASELHLSVEVRVIVHRYAVNPLDLALGMGRHLAAAQESASAQLKRSPGSRTTSIWI